jgi:hypothetical protein
MVAERFGPRATVDSLFDTYLQQPSPVFSTSSTSNDDELDPPSEPSSSSEDKPTERRRGITAKPLGDKKEKRRAQNRKAAANSREKKRKYHESLEDEVKTRTRHEIVLILSVPLFLSVRGLLTVFSVCLCHFRHQSSPFPPAPTKLTHPPRF